MNSPNTTAESLISAETFNPTCMRVLSPPYSSTSVFSLSLNLVLPASSQRLRGFVAPTLSEKVPGLGSRPSRGE